MPEEVLRRSALQLQIISESKMAVFPSNKQVSIPLLMTLIRKGYDNILSDTIGFDEIGPRTQIVPAFETENLPKTEYQLWWLDYLNKHPGLTSIIVVPGWHDDPILIEHTMDKDNAETVMIAMPNGYRSQITGFIPGKDSRYKLKSAQGKDMNEIFLQISTVPGTTSSVLPRQAIK